MITQFRLKIAAAVCHNGGVIAYPTESVFGLGCNPDDFSAIEKLLYLKQRPMDKGLILIASRIEQLLAYIQISDEELHTIGLQHAPPTTWLVTASARTPEWITGRHEKVAIRLTQHPVAKQLCEQLTFPLVSTSANPAGKVPAHTSLKARMYFGNEVDYYLSGNTGLSKKPTQIVDLESGKILRAG